MRSRPADHFSWLQYRQDGTKDQGQAHSSVEVAGIATVRHKLGFVLTAVNNRLLFFLVQDRMSDRVWLLERWTKFYVTT